MTSVRAWWGDVLRVVRGAPAPARPPRVRLEGVRLVPALALRVAAVLALCGAFLLLDPAVVAWFIVVPLLATALAPGGAWGAVVAATFVGVSLASVDAGLRSAALGFLLPLAVQLSLLAEAASRSDQRSVGVDVRLVVRALRSAAVVAGVVVPVIALVSAVEADLPPSLGLLAAVGVVGLGVVVVRLAGSDRVRR